MHVAQQVHAPLGIAGGLGEAAARRRGESAGIRRLVEQAIVEQLIEQQGMPGDELGRPARRADDARDPLERVGMLGEQREIGGAARDRLEQRDSSHERRVRIGRCLGRARERRHDPVEAPA